MAVSLPLVYGFVFVGLVILGLIIAPALLGPDFADPDTIVPTLATKYCPPIVSFISLLCIFAFAVSTSDSMLLSASAMASRDIYGRWKYELKGKAVEPKRTVFFARVVLVIMMIICILISMFKPTYITDYAYSLCSPFFAMIMPCTIGGLWWKKGTKEGAWAGTVAGLIVVFLLTFFITPPLGFSALVWGLVVNTVLYIIVSLCTKCPEEVVDKYITRIGSIINCSTELKEKTGNALKAARMSSVSNVAVTVPAMA